MGIRGTGLDDGSAAERPGGVGTITRPAAPHAAPPPVQPQRTGRPRPAPRRPGQAGPGHLGYPGRPGRPGLSGYAGRTLAPGAARRRAATTSPAAAARGLPRHSQRMPFFLLLCGLLGGALICALVISTTLAAGSYQISRLQQANEALARQRQVLQDQVATAQSAQSIQQLALRLGMRPAAKLRFLNLKTGKIQTDAGTGANADIRVPGYNP